jgi:3-deoxy-D-manno-octulosonic acid (KDO) 8-phosphate synthase
MDRGEAKNVQDTVTLYLKQLEEYRVRTDISPTERTRLKNETVSKLFAYLSEQRDYLIAFPEFKAVTISKAGQFLSDPQLTSENAKENIRTFLRIAAGTQFQRSGKRKTKKRGHKRKTRKHTRI